MVLIFPRESSHGVGSSLPCPVLQLGCGFNNGSWLLASPFFPQHQYFRVFIHIINAFTINFHIYGLVKYIGIQVFYAVYPFPKQVLLPFVAWANVLGKYSNLFPSILSSSSSRSSRVKFLKLWIISFLSSVINLAFMSSSSLVYGVSKPSYELWNDPNSGISLPCLSYREPDFELALVMQL